MSDGSRQAKPIIGGHIAEPGQAGWVIARVPSNREFTVHQAVSRPLKHHIWRAEPLSEGPGRFREPVYDKGPACYCPVRITLTKKNQFTDLKQEPMTERPFPIYKGYLFIKDPSYPLIERLRERSLCYGLVPGIPMARNNYKPGPLRLTQKAIDRMRDRFRAEYDPETGAGHRTTSRPEAYMNPGYEYQAQDYVHSDDPAWQGHRLHCVEVLDKTAKVICQMFGIDHEVEVPLSSLRKAV